jgi:hypothetical protein
LIYQQDINAAKYGPNKYKNKKIRQIDYEVEARFDANDKSANIVNATISGESNQIGFFVDPQDSKNKDIIRYVGRDGIMKYISDPADLYSDRYYSLRNKNAEYVSSGNKRTYFNELLTVYKFYFDKSIFEAIKNILPARANIYTGVVIEPTILERPKYQHKYIESSVEVTYQNSVTINRVEDITTTGLWLNFNDDFSGMTSESQVTIKNTLPPNYTETIDLTDINLPTRMYPSNLDNGIGGYITDFMDKIQHGYYPDFEELPRLWEATGSTNGIYGSISQLTPDDLFVIGPDQNRVIRPEYYTGTNTGSHQILYYMLKVWDEYHYYAKTGEYVRTENPADNTQSSASVYLYNYIVVDESFMRRNVYWYDLLTLPTPFDADPSYTYSSGYKHRVNTFINTPDQRVSNVKATNIVGFVNFTQSLKPQKSYFEMARGYPRNHYTHKMTQFSKDQHATVDVIYVKGKNTTKTTINEQGITDGTFPVQSSNTSNVNVITAGNVLQYGQGGGGPGVGTVVPGSGGTSTGTGGSTTGGSTRGLTGGSSGNLGYHGITP